MYFRFQPSWFEDATRNQAIFKCGLKASTFHLHYGRRKQTAVSLFSENSGSQRRNLYICNFWDSSVSISDQSSHHKVIVMFPPTMNQLLPLREGTFFIGGGGWAGALERRSLVNTLQIGEGQTCLIRSWGRVTVFLARKILLHVG